MTPFLIVHPISPLVPGAGGPDIDLWLGGPNADGRGLDTVNGGYAPAPGLAIVSPSSSTPSSSARFLIRDSLGVWRDKAAGVLACIGGRVWTGSGWTYTGATAVEARGPLPALAVPGITDTVRRYTTIAGRTVSDAPGGVIQPYSQRVDVDAGYTGGGFSVTPREMWASAAAGDFVYWHSIVEYPTGNTWRPNFGLYDTGFFAGLTEIDIDSLTVTSNMTNSAAGVRHLGTGPNGGRLIEIWGGARLGDTRTNLSVQAYLLRAIDASTPRTCWIHNHYAVLIPHLYGRIYGFPSWCLVAAGAAPSLAAEEIAVTTTSARPVSMVVRTTGTDPADVGYFDALASTSYVVFYRHSSAYRWSSPTITFGTVDYTTPRTLTLRVAADDTVTGALDGVLSRVGGTNTGSLTGTWYVGGRTQYRGVMPLRRVQIWSRHITDAEVVSSHDAIVTAETK